jgi:hypothetical protein
MKKRTKQENISHKNKYKNRVKDTTKLRKYEPVNYYTQQLLTIGQAKKQKLTCKKSRRYISGRTF